jgi:diadenosine tetraphosphatase ApaH/serine/threonine PP2A family protein phosphatase
MKIAIISDIHSNIEALTACCHVAENEGAEKFVCLGDCVGYGPDPVAVLDMLQALPGFSCVLGNHDEHTFNCIDINCLAPVQVVAEWTARQLSEAHLDFLKSLPYVLVDNGVSYVHATMSQPGSWGYITTIDQARQCMVAASTNLVFYGHVHIPMIFHERRDDSIELIHPEGGKTYSLHQNHRYVINAGSVGQPRDDNNSACFVLYDEESHSVTFHRVKYDYSRTIEKIHENKLPAYFAERLESGC